MEQENPDGAVTSGENSPIAISKGLHDRDFDRGDLKEPPPPLLFLHSEGRAKENNSKPGSARPGQQG